jgi:hypothetical protein
MKKHLVVGGAICAMVAQLGCASAPTPKIEPAVARYAGKGCRTSDVHVRSTRQVEGDTVYVVDACGSVFELERGLALPVRRKELSEITAENPLELPSRVKRVMPDGVVEIMRRKVQRWCVLGPPDPEAAERVVFYSATPEEHAHCQARLAQSLTPLGTEIDLETNGEVYWFSLGQYVFTTTESLYEPPPEHRSIASAAPDSPRRLKLHRGEPGAARAARDAPSAFFGRVELGLGYLHYDDPEAPYDGIAWNTYVEAGGKLTRDVGLGARLATHWGLAAPQVDQQPHVLDIALASTFYPDPDAGFVLQAHAGCATLAYGYDFENLGPSFGGSLGADFGDRGKAKSADNWTGSSLQLRGTVSEIDDRWLQNVGLYVGIYFW